jgi:hypothetical protein
MAEQEPVRLTQLSHGGGCGCKIAPAKLQQVLEHLRKSLTVAAAGQHAPHAFCSPKSPGLLDPAS